MVMLDCEGFGFWKYIIKIYPYLTPLSSGQDRYQVEVRRRVIT